MADQNPQIESSADSVSIPFEDKSGNSSYTNQRANLFEKSKGRERRSQASDREESRKQHSNNNRKNKRNDSKFSGDRHKLRDVGRGELSRGNRGCRRKNNEGPSTKRRKIEASSDDIGRGQTDDKEDTGSEKRRPKRKVAVMIGYAGTGYKGMQVNNEEKTIEGDIFQAFIAAGAISKANADDPKKSSLVRCARTDKGVHAAGNVISLKLIVEDSDIVQKINENLPPQIRVWGYERTNGGFSCYQSCDSRWYEYLIPTYSFIPPHPKSFLGQKLVEYAKKEEYLEAYSELQEDVSSFWQNAMENHVMPVLERLDQSLGDEAIALVHKEVNDMETKKVAEDELIEVTPEKILDTDHGNESVHMTCGAKTGLETQTENTETNELSGKEISKVSLSPLESAIREIKAAYITAKNSYRISSKRLSRVQEVLNCYVGTHNFHNFTVQKKFSDPSARRHVKSFDIVDKPIIINDTEWLSMKVHGQSFMMHQIRKMVGMTALVVRCATPVKRVVESYEAQRISIPKAPGLGLLLERPVFDTYNHRAIAELSRKKIDFDEYKTEIDEFKQREIYDRIFREEERDHQFHSFFHHLDHFRSENFLWVTAGGMSISKIGPTRSEKKTLRDESDDDVAINDEES